MPLNLERANEKKKLMMKKKADGGRQVPFSLMKRKKKYLWPLSVALIDDKGINDLMATKCPFHPRKKKWDLVITKCSFNKRKEKTWWALGTNNLKWFYCD